MYLLCTCISTPICNFPHQSATFGETGEVTLVNHDLPESVVYPRVHSGWVHLMGLDQSYSIIESISTLLKILCAQIRHFTVCNSIFLVY